MTNWLCRSCSRKERGRDTLGSKEKAWVISHLLGASSSCWSQRSAQVSLAQGTPLGLSCCWRVLCSTGTVAAAKSRATSRAWLTGLCCFCRNVTWLLSALGSRFSCLWPGLYPQLIHALPRLLFKPLRGEFCALGGNDNFLQASQAFTVSNLSQNNHIDFNSALLLF